MILQQVQQICDVGGSGKLYVEVFNNYDGILQFYYPSPIASDLLTSIRVDGNTYELPIVAAAATGSLTVVNEIGCQVSADINLEIGTPSFSYSSINSNQTGTTSSGTPLINAREEVTFTNTSTGTYSYLEWDFGDGSPR